MEFYIFHDAFCAVSGIFGALISAGIYLNLIKKKKEIMLNTFFLAGERTVKELKVILFSFIIIFLGFVLYTYGKITRLTIISDSGKLLTEISAMLTIIVFSSWLLRMRKVG
ncbi:MAG: hypothetical protein QW609_03135 [Candidatus Aenigmatarchaeota archaeon]